MCWQAGQYLSFAQDSFIAILKQQKVISDLVVQNTSSAIDSLADASKKCEDPAIRLQSDSIQRATDYRP